MRVEGLGIRGYEQGSRDEALGFRFRVWAYVEFRFSAESIFLSFGFVSWGLKIEGTELQNFAIGEWTPCMSYRPLYPPQYTLDPT